MFNISNHGQWQAFANSLSKGKKQHCFLLWCLPSLVKMDVHVRRDKGCSFHCTEKRQQPGSSRRTALIQGQGQGQGQALPCCRVSHPGCSGGWLITRQTENNRALIDDYFTLRHLLVKGHSYPATNTMRQEHITQLIFSTPAMAALSLEKFSNKPLPLLAQLNLWKGDWNVSFNMESETAFGNSESSYVVGKFKEQLWSLWRWLSKKLTTELREININYDI